MSLALETLTGVFQTILDASLHAAFLVVVVLFVQHLFRRQISSQCRYLLWLIVVGRLLLPTVPQSKLSVLGIFQESTWTNAPSVTRDVSEGFEATTPTNFEQPLDLSAADKPEQINSAERPPSVNMQPLEAGDTPTRNRLGMMYIASLVWFLGFMVLVGRDLVMHFRIRLFVDAMEHLPDSRLTRIFDQCKHEMHVTRNVTLLTCNRLIPPGIFGVFRTSVILPRSLSLELTNEEIRFIFLHELTHFQRRDVPFAFVTSLLRCVHWFNPLVWYAEIRMTEDRELACDAAVLRRITPKQYQSYGETVVKVLEQLITAKPAFGTVSMAYGKASMKRRLSMLSSFQKPTWRQFGVGTMLLFTLTVTGLSQPLILDAELGLATQGNEALPKHAVLRLGTDKLRHDGDASYLAFSPDGKWIACSSTSGQVFIFDALTGQRLRRIEIIDSRRGSPIFGRVCGLQFSSVDGALVVGAANQIVYYSPVTGEVLRTLTIGLEDLVKLNLNWRFDISEDGGKIAVHAVESSVCIVLDANSGKETTRFGRQGGQIHQANFAPDGKSLATTSNNPGVRVWDPATGTLKHTLPGHAYPHGSGIKSYSMRLKYSPDGKTLATGAGNEAFLWDVRAKQLYRKLSSNNRKDLFMAIAFTPDSKAVAAGSQEGDVYVWDTDTGKLRFELSGNIRHLRSIAISPDGTRLAASFAYNAIRLWDLRTGKPLLANLAGHEAPVEAVAFSPDGSRIASGGGNHQILVWDARSGELVRSLDTEVSSSSLHFLSDGRQLVSGWRNKEGISVWDVESGERLYRLMQFGLPRNNHVLKAFRLSEDEERLLVAGYDRSRSTIQFSSWDIENQQRSRKFIEGNVWNTTAVAIAPSCNLAAIGGKDIRIWDLRDGQRIAELKGHKHNVKSLAFSPDGERLVSGSLDGTVRIWDCNTFEQLLVFNPEQPIAVVSMSPNGEVIAAGGGAREYPVRSANLTQVVFWDANSGEHLGYVSGKNSNVTALSFSADGDRIVSGHQDGSLFVWKVPGTED